MVLIGIFVFCYAYSVFYASESKIKVTSLPSLSEGELKDFIMVAQRFADNHEFSNSYNCQSYTRDLKQIADNLGFNVEHIIGCNSSSPPKKCHAWLKLIVDFEPQYAIFTDYSKKYPYQRKND